MSSAFRAIGTTLKLGDGGSPEAFTTIAELKQISANRNQEFVDVTNHDSTNNFREELATFKGAQVTFSGNFLPENATQDETTGIQEAFDSQTLDNYQLIFSNAGNHQFAFAAYIGDLNVDANFDEAASVSGTLRVSGAVTVS